MKKPKQLGALCWRRRKGRLEILLVTSRESKRWILPKGWPMPGLADFNAARREAFEEAGVEGRMRRRPLGRFTYDKRGPGGRLLVSITVYILAVRRELRNWPEKNSRQRAWFAPADAARLVAEAGLKRLLLSFDA